MAELKNSFSWSFSAAGVFESCRRKRYWGKYAMWNGWSSSATDIQKAAYRLSKMDNRFSIQGQAVEQAVMWVLREKQEGRDVTVDEAYQTMARPYLRKCWRESRDKVWQANPKKHCCLHEHYYPNKGKASDEEWTPAIVENVRRCIENFMERVLPRLVSVTKDQEVEIQTPDKGGDPESFEIEGIKIYAIPDYVYTEGDRWNIIDWKSGKPNPSHRDQLALYGLWAHIKHKVPADQIMVYIEYLSEGKTAVESFSQEDLDQVMEKISVSVGEMREYLEDGDLGENKPVPREEWELTPERQLCARCNYFELCEPEFES